MRTLQRRLVRVAAAAVAVVVWGAVIVAPTGASAAIVITEFLANPNAVSDAAGEWVEIFNTGAIAVDINGWTLSDDGLDSHTINNGGALTVFAGDFLVLARNSNTAGNGGLVVDYEYGTFALGNNGDEIVLSDTSLVEIDRVDYTSAWITAGRSRELDELFYDSVSNDSLGNWSLGTVVYGDGDLGTPGFSASIPPNPVPLPAALPLFLSALAGLGLMGWRRRQAGA